MIVIWRGLGILWPFTLVIGFVVGHFVGDFVPLVPREMLAIWTAVIFGFLGVKLLLSDPEHALFFLPLKVWNFMFALFVGYLTWGALDREQGATSKESRDEAGVLTSKEERTLSEVPVLTVQVSSSDKDKVTAEFVLPTAMKSWTDDSGREMRAELLMIRREVEGDFTIQIRKEGGKEHTFSYQRLDKEGKDFVKRCFLANQ